MKLETSVKHQLKRIRETSRVFPKRTELASGDNREFATVRVGGTKAGPVDRNELSLKAMPENNVAEARKSNDRVERATSMLWKNSRICFNQHDWKLCNFIVCSSVPGINEKGKCRGAGVDAGEIVTFEFRC
jgi:hypothetical protein